MIHQLSALIVDESKWLAVSMTLATLAVLAVLYRYRSAAMPVRCRVLAAMNLFFGLMIGTMALGHLLAVTTKLALGTLEGGAVIFYLIGIALAIPSWWLIDHTRRVLASDADHGRVTMGLNLWTAATLLVLGLHNLPLAAQAFLNIAYQLHSRRFVGWAIVSLAVVANLGLFIGSLIFLASGQSFEEFRGLP